MIFQLIRHIFPTFLFFFVAFSLVDLAEIVTHKSLQSISYSFMVIFAASLVMAKVVLISDCLPFIDTFSKKPLIYNTLWKALIYVACSTLVRGLDRLIPEVLKGQAFGEAFSTMLESCSHLTFWVSEIWLAVLMFIYAAGRELVHAVGKEKLKKLFFG